MENRFLNFISQNNLLSGSKKILLGVSGGPDSLTMLDLFNKLKVKLGIKIAAAHLDHNFRKESQAEAEFVKKLTLKLNIDFYSKSVNLPQIIKRKKNSPEAEARYQRFNFFEKIIKNNDFDCLALAHHSDDQAETVLLNLFRGSGLTGLTGIQPQSEYKALKIIHPLLDFSKEEILNYSRKNKLEAKFDSSNQKNIYSRNIIRNKIFPIIENEINENVKEVINRNSSLIKTEDDYLKEVALKNYKEILCSEKTNKITINFAEFKKINQVLQRRIYRHIYNQLNNDLNDFYLEHILEIEKLITDDKTGRGVDLAGDLRVEISYDKLIFLKKDLAKELSLEKKQLRTVGRTQINKKYFIESKIIKRKDFNFSNDPYQAAFDYQKIKFPLFIRQRKAGDKFIPLGMKGHKKVKDILIDKKVPRYQREQIPLVIDSEDEIIWLAPYRLAADFKITEKTEKILILKLNQLEDNNGTEFSI